MLLHKLLTYCLVFVFLHHVLQLQSIFYKTSHRLPLYARLCDFELV